MGNYTNTISLFLLLFIVYLVSKIIVGIYFLIFSKKMINPKKKIYRTIDETFYVISKIILIFELILDVIYIFKGIFIAPFFVINYDFLSFIDYFYYIIYNILILYFIIVLDKMSGVGMRLTRILLGLNFLLISYLQLFYYILGG